MFSYSFQLWNKLKSVCLNPNYFFSEELLSCEPTVVLPVHKMLVRMSLYVIWLPTTEDVTYE